MNLKQTQLYPVQAIDLSEKAKTAYLSTATRNIKGMLDLFRTTRQASIISYFWQKERAKYVEKEGKGIDFSTAYWSPPMSGPAVYEIEREQMNTAGLEAIVSVTDHDSIDACLQVNETQENRKAPISLEWTVPFDYGFFHVGVHNLPKDRAVEITKTLLDYTFGENPTDEKLTEMFVMLNDIRLSDPHHPSVLSSCRYRASQSSQGVFKRHGAGSPFEEMGSVWSEKSVTQWRLWYPAGDRWRQAAASPNRYQFDQRHTLKNSLTDQGRKRSHVVRCPTTNGRFTHGSYSHLLDPRPS